jgi:IMP dehydrogenase
MQDRIAYTGITFDDVLLEPGYSDVVPRDVDVRTRLTRNVRINIPIVSSPMDTVTESELAIALAQEGGIGIIHKNLTVAAQTREVDKVKRSENGIITDPITLPPDATVGHARQLMEEHHVSGVPITVGPDKLLKGILTRRDLKFLDDNQQKISEVMTSKNLVTAPENTTLEAAQQLLTRNKVEKLLLVDDQFRLKGLITIRDIDKTQKFPHACKDARGRLKVGAAVGVHDFERAASLIGAGVDVLVVDSAHGHSRNVIETVRRIKKQHTIDVIAGNVATAEGAKALVDAGADCVKAGIGPGSICTTRIVSGVGVPQMSAIANVAKGLAGTGVPLIADGGIRYSGDITKALAGGAFAVMIGGLFAGLAESPGQTILYRGRSFKQYRGMGSMGAMVAGSADRYQQAGTAATSGTPSNGKLVPEGVEGRVPYKGHLDSFVYQLVGGLRAGMGYCGCKTLEELREKARFIQVTAASVQESHPHDIFITQEAPNYSSADAGGAESA